MTQHLHFPDNHAIYVCIQGAKKIIFTTSFPWFSPIRGRVGENPRNKVVIFTACHSGKLKLVFTRPDVISTSPKSFLISRTDFPVLLLFEFLKKHLFPFGQVKNRIYSLPQQQNPPAPGYQTLLSLYAGISDIKWACLFFYQLSDKLFVKTH